MRKARYTVCSATMFDTCLGAYNQAKEVTMKHTTRNTMISLIVSLSLLTFGLAQDPLAPAPSGPDPMADPMAEPALQPTTLNIMVEPEGLSGLLITITSSEGEEVFFEELAEPGEIIDIPAGEYVVSAAAPGFVTDGQVVELVEGQLLDVTLTLEETDGTEESANGDENDNDDNGIIDDLEDTLDDTLDDLDDTFSDDDDDDESND